MKYASILLLSLLVLSCGKKNESPSTSTSTTSVHVPKFSADSAYAFVQQQVDFGPRIPNTEPHRKTAAYLESKLKSYGAQVTVQSFKATTHDNSIVDLRNIIASFNPEKQKRIMLAAHWDTRPYADKDSVNKTATFDGANDGASGVGVLLEIARQLQAAKPRAGVDIVLFDGEDWGPREDNEVIPTPPQGWEDWWCLGSQHWSKNPHKPGYRAYFGILLDMVGAPDARFFREGTSVEYAPRVIDKVWSAAATLGYGDLFVNQETHALTDDHLFVNKNAKIPMIDIVQYDSRTGWGSYHHTTKDDMSVIDKRTLNAVGQTVMYVVFREE